MILKICTTYNKKCQDVFYDNFDSITVDKCVMKDEIYPESCPVSVHTESGRTVEVAKRLTLVSGNNVFYRVVYVDLLFSTFLMSNEGKTIERLN